MSLMIPQSYGHRGYAHAANAVAPHDAPRAKEDGRFAVYRKVWRDVYATDESGRKVKVGRTSHLEVQLRKQEES